MRIGLFKLIPGPHEVGEEYCVQSVKRSPISVQRPLVHGPRSTVEKYMPMFDMEEMKFCDGAQFEVEV